VRFDRVRLAERDIDVAAVGLPARLAGGKVLVGVCDAPVVLFAELVLRRIRIGIAAQPELLDEGVALFIVAQALEGLAPLRR
jgi:putative intracellular protease/amidase